MTNLPTRRGGSKALVRAGALCGALGLSALAAMADENVQWRNTAPTWKPASVSAQGEANRPQGWKVEWAESPIPSGWIPVETTAPADNRAAATLAPPQRVRDIEPVTYDRVGTYLPPAVDKTEPSRIPLNLRINEPDAPETPTQNVARASETLEVIPRPVIEVEQLPNAKVYSSLDRLLPPEKIDQPLDGSPPAPAIENPAVIEKPRGLGHRIANLFNKNEASVDEGGEHEWKIFRGQLFEAIGVGKPKLYWRDEVLLWRMNNDRVPALATTGTPASGGIIGEPGTELLFGPGPIDLQDRIGERSRGRLLFPDHNWGVDGSFMFLGPRGSNFSFASNAYPVLSRPVFVLNQPPGEFVETVAFPGFSVGALTIQANTKFWSADVNIFKRLCDDECQFLDLFVGYRYGYFAEGLRVTENIIAQEEAPDPIGTYAIVTDGFGTRNLFNGAQVGVDYERRYGRWFVDLRASAAIGVNSQTIEVEGFQVRQRPGQIPEVFTGGLLAATSNIGRFSRARFSVIPDVSLNVGYQVTPGMRAFAGYSVMYWSNVVRPGRQIDRVVDLTFIPNTPPTPPSGQRRPTVPFNESDLFLHGLTFGLEWMF